MGQVGDLRDGGGAGEADGIAPLGQHGLRIHPDDVGGELVGHFRSPVFLGDRVAAPDVDRFEYFREGRAAVPGRAAAGREDVLAGQRGNRDRAHLFDPHFARERLEFSDDRGEHALVVIDQVHLVDREDRPPDPHERNDVAVTPGLGQHPLACVDENHGQIRIGCPRDQVSRVLLVAGRIDGDELAPGGFEIATGDVAGDPVFELRQKPVRRRGEVDRVAPSAGCRAPGLGRPELVARNLAGVVQQTAEQRRLAVVHRTADDQAELVLAAPGGGKGIHVPRSGAALRGRRHQKQPSCSFFSMEPGRPSAGFR